MALCVGLQPSASVYSLCALPAGCVEMFSCERKTKKSLGREKGRVTEKGCVCVCVCIRAKKCVLFNPLLCLSLSCPSPCPSLLSVQTHAASAFQWRVTPVIMLLWKLAKPLNVCVGVCVCVCVHVCVWLYAPICLLHVCISMHKIYTYCLGGCMCVWMHLCFCVCVCLCLCVCVCVRRRNTHTRTHSLAEMIKWHQMTGQQGCLTL